MLVRNLNNCCKITAGDKTALRELLHPGKENLGINYSLAHAVLKKGQTSLPHRLKTSEVYYILEGQGIMHMDNETEPVKKDYVVLIPPDSVQYIKNTGNRDLKFLCIVAPPWQKNNEEILQHKST